MIITANDLGPGWTGTKPEIDIMGFGGQRPAMVRLLYANDSSFCEITCRLYLYSTWEEANDSYEGGSMSSTQSRALDVGDRAMLGAGLNDTNVIVHWLLKLQKGNAVVWMSTESYGGPVIDEAQMVELAEVQAAKLP